MVRATPTRRRPAKQLAPLAPGESVFAPRPYQRAFIADRSRSKAAMWSRQTGKGFAVALEVNSDILETEARGDAIDWMIISRSLIAARQLGRKVRGVGRALCQAQRLMEPTVAELGESQTELTYPGGSRVLILSSSPDAAVGHTGNVVIDEIDTHKQAFELLTNTLPVASTADHRVIVTSTPRGHRVMHKLWQDAGKDGTQWSFHRLTIHEAVAQGCNQDPAVLERQITAVDPLKWRQEYLCEFVDDEICWIPWELIAGCTSDRATMAPIPMPPVTPGTVWETYAGWDVARWNHLSVLYIINKFGPLCVTRGIRIMQRLPFEEQLAHIESDLARFPLVRRLVIDAGGMGEMPFETAKRRFRFPVEGIKFSTQIKETIASDVRRVMEERHFLIPDHERVQTDFHSLRRTQTSAGNARFEGESNGSHADIFWAAGGALHGALSSSGSGLCFIDTDTPRGIAAAAPFEITSVISNNGTQAVEVQP